MRRYVHSFQGSFFVLMLLKLATQRLYLILNYFTVNPRGHSAVPLGVVTADLIAVCKKRFNTSYLNVKPRNYSFYKNGNFCKGTSDSKIIAGAKVDINLVPLVLCCWITFQWVFLFMHCNILLIYYKTYWRVHSEGLQLNCHVYGSLWK